MKIEPPKFPITEGLMEKARGDLTLLFAFFTNITDEERQKSVELIMTMIETVSICSKDEMLKWANDNLQDIISSVEPKIQPND